MHVAQWLNVADTRFDHTNQGEVVLYVFSVKNFLKSSYNSLIVASLFIRMPNQSLVGGKRPSTTIVTTVNDILTHLFHDFNGICITKHPFCLRK